MSLNTDENYLWDTGCSPCNLCLSLRYILHLYWDKTFTDFSALLYRAISKVIQELLNWPKENGKRFPLEIFTSFSQNGLWFLYKGINLSSSGALGQFINFINLYILYKYWTGDWWMKCIIKKYYEEFHKSKNLNFTRITIFFNMKYCLKYFIILCREIAWLQTYMWKEMERMLQAQSELLHSLTALCSPI